MKKLQVFLISALLCGCVAQPPATGDGSSSSSSVSSSSVALETYTNTQMGFTLQYPSNWDVQEGDSVVTEGPEFTGTSLVYPADADQTTLLEAKFNMSVQPTCPAQTSSTTVTLGTHTFTRSTWSGVGAGNLYQGNISTITQHGSCYVFTEYMHSCNIGPDCSAGHTEAFDPKNITNIFDTVLSSLQFTSQASSSSTTAAAGGCVIGGCSAQLCYDPATDSGISNCLYSPTFACYKTATCARQSDGKCGWTQTADLKQCLANTK